jgi:hypothetical protein
VAEGEQFHLSWIDIIYMGVMQGVEQHNGCGGKRPADLNARQSYFVGTPVGGRRNVGWHSLQLS